nr:hypothetical protein [Gemmatimonadaceae bacterium]
YASAALPDAVGAREAALAALFDAMPALARRGAPSAGAGAATADLGALARLAWRLPLPEGPVAAALRPIAEPPTVGGVLHAWPRGGTAGCSPVAQGRLLPVRAEAIALADALLRPRVAAGLRRWAARPAPADEPEPARRLRAALLGAPADAGDVARAEDLGVLAARRALPCLGDLPAGLGADAARH